MTATLWLLAALVLTLLCALTGVWIGKSWHAARQALDYRTINVATMDSDLRKLQRRVPDATPCPPVVVERPRVRAGQARNVIPMPQGTLAQVRAQAITAALRDMGTGSNRPNPYAHSDARHATWQTAYDQLLTDRKTLQEELAASAPVQARAHSEA